MAAAGGTWSKGRFVPAKGKARADHPIVKARFTVDQTDRMQAYQQLVGQNNIPFDLQDTVLKAIMKDQGFDAAPQVVSEQSLDRYVAQGEREIWRGLRWGGNDGETLIKGFVRDFMEGDVYVGRGERATGIYAAPRLSGAVDYAASSSNSALLRMTIKRGAKIIKLGTIRQELDAIRRRIGRDAFQKNPLYEDPARYAAAKGYDGISFRSYDDRSRTEIVILNRSAVRVQKRAYYFKNAEPDAIYASLGRQP